MNVLNRLMRMYYGAVFYFRYRSTYKLTTKNYTPNQKEFIKTFNQVKTISLTSESFNILVTEKLTLLLNDPLNIKHIHSFVGVIGGVYINNCPKLSIKEVSSNGCENLHYFIRSLFNSMETQEHFFLLLFVVNKLMTVFQNEYLSWILAFNSIVPEGD